MKAFSFFSPFELTLCIRSLSGFSVMQLHYDIVKQIEFHAGGVSFFLIACSPFSRKDKKVQLLRSWNNDWLQ